MDIEEEFRQRNFALSVEDDAQGRPRRIVRMTKDGFMLPGQGQSMASNLKPWRTGRSVTSAEASADNDSDLNDQVPMRREWDKAKIGFMDRASMGMVQIWTTNLNMDQT